MGNVDLKWILKQKEPIQERILEEILQEYIFI